MVGWRSADSSDVQLSKGVPALTCAVCHPLMAGGKLSQQTQICAKRQSEPTLQLPGWLKLSSFIFTCLEFSC